MYENGYKNKDQLQCRTHGQKYLLGIEEIREKIEKKKQNEKLDQKFYQKLQKYHDDKRYLYGLYLEDKKNPEDTKLEFQSDQAEKMFMDTIPKYIQQR